MRLLDVVHVQVDFGEGELEDLPAHVLITERAD